MVERQLKLSGWQAIVVIIVLFGVVVVRLTTFGDQKNNSALMEKLDNHLVAEYLSGDVARLRAALESGDKQHAETVGRSVASTKVNVQKVQASFPLFNFSSTKRVIVKVTFSLDDANGTRETRTVYYQFKHSVIGDSWSYQRDSSALSYYLNFL